MLLRPVKSGGVVIDSDFREIISVILTNHWKETTDFNLEDRIVQMLFLRKEDVEFTDVDELDDTERGFDGFGYAGK